MKTDVWKMRAHCIHEKLIVGHTVGLQMENVIT